MSTLIAGTAVSQGVMLLALLALTRLYTPEDFGILASFTGVLTVLAVGACLRLEIAIPLPENDRDAAALLILAIGGATLLSALLACAVVAFRLIGDAASIERMGVYVWLLPAGVLVTGYYSAFQHWAVRKRRFNAIAATRVGQAASGAGIQIGLGVTSSGPLGLIVGHVLYGGAGFLYLARHAVSDIRALGLPAEPSSLMRVARQYRRFPAFSFPESLANTASFHLPPLLIAVLQSSGEAGAFYLALRVMYGPTGLVSHAISQVVLSRAGDEIRAGTLSRFVIRATGNLLRFGVGPIFFLGIIAPMMFPAVFGEEWARAGVLASWLTLAMGLQFLTSSLQVLLPATNRQVTALASQVCGLALRIGSLLAMVFVIGDGAGEAFGAASALFFAGYCLVLMSSLEVDRLGLWREVVRSAPAVLGWSLLGVGLRALV